MRRCLRCQVVDGSMHGCHGISYVLGSKELKMYEHEGFQVSFLVFCFSGSVKSLIWSYYKTSK